MHLLGCSALPVREARKLTRRFLLDATDTEMELKTRKQSLIAVLAGDAT